MRSFPLFVAITLATVALAGCADETAAPPATTPTASTPTATTPATPTPATPTHDEPMTPPVCDPTTTAPEPIGQKMGYRELVITVEEPSEGDPCYQFVAPESTTAGWTAVTFRNNGKAPHIMPMYYLGNKTLDDFVAAAATGGEPDWAIPVGGVGFVTPFSSATALLELKEGNYAIVCFFAGHHMQGMYRGIQVTAADPAQNATTEPTTDLVFSAVDYNFTVPENITNGTYIVKFVNNGTEPHEFPLIKLNDNTTLEQFIAAVESETPTGPPPGAGIGGVNTIAAGTSAYAIVDFARGDHGLLCFVGSDKHGGVPHLALGMSRQFSVA